MKVLKIIIGIIILAFVVIQIFAIYSQMNIETYPYTVKKKYDKFEIRNYEASLFTSVKTSSNEYKNASRQGFSILAGYIFGENDKNEKNSYDLTRINVIGGLYDNDVYGSQGKQKRNTSPAEQNHLIKFQEEPAKTVASISFGGWANDEKIEGCKKQLKAALDAEGIIYTNQFYFLGYNAPYEFFNRKNEIIVEL